MLEKMLGQFLMLGFEGCFIDESHSIINDIVESNIGGVILFSHNVNGSRQNIESPDQLIELTTKLQNCAPTPLLISVDQEGGQVCRLKEADGFPATFSAGALGRLNDVDRTRQQARQQAEILSDCGINFNLAPVVDLNINSANPIIGKYDRSFSADCGIVVKHGSVFIEEHHKKNIACCLKHFPGHGSSGTDSHLNFVDITKTWREDELQPYVDLFQAGFGDAIMTAHVIQKKLDPAGVPATVSSVLIQKILRQKLGFQGVTLSDDLQMKAISKLCGFKDAVQAAILAGVDIIIIGNNLLRQQDCAANAVMAIKELLDNGKISPVELEKRLDRISLLKGKIKGTVEWKIPPLSSCHETRSTV